MSGSDRARGRGRQSVLHAVGPTGEEPSRSTCRLSAGRRWRLRRDMVIYVAHTHGVSQRMLGDVFDLPHSRISVIVRNMRERYGNPDAKTEG